MCQTRAFQYGCGHANCRHLSTCRGTYTDSKGSTVLCHAPPSLTITVSVPCSNCLYTKFREEWERRLSEAEERHAVVCQMLHEIQDDGASCGELGSEFFMDSSGLGDPLGDADTASRERQRAEDQLKRLKLEYERESMMQWSSFLNGESQSTKQILRRQRRPSPRYSGCSPLKNVQSIEEVAAESDEERDEGNQTVSEMSRSPSLVSDNGSALSSSSEELGELYQPSLDLQSANNWGPADAVYEQNMSPIRAKSTGSFGAPLMTKVADDEADEEDMLPNYGF